MIDYYFLTREHKYKAVTRWSVFYLWNAIGGIIFLRFFVPASKNPMLLILAGLFLFTLTSLSLWRAK